MNSDIQSYINANTRAMRSLLEELVLIQSYSRNKAGVDRVGQRIAREMTEMGFSCTFSTSAEFGNTLIARSPGINPSGLKKETAPVLITGHMDTVFPEHSPFNWYKEDETRCYGPGVADMKGGLVTGIFALKALAECQVPHGPVTFVFNSDEEIGSPSSRDLIQKEARTARLAYVLEAGGLGNEIVTGRKGNFTVTLTITGRAGHAAFADKDKASAILELAQKIIAIEEMNDPASGISANAGVIKGGIGANTVPDFAEAALDFRFLTPEQALSVESQFSRIAQKTFVAGTSSSLKVISSRPAMPQTPENLALYNQIKPLADTLNIPVAQELRQGVSDANIIAQAGTPVIDGLGPIGAKDHSHEEYIEKDSLRTRSILLAHILAGI